MNTLRVRELREAAGLTKVELARKARVDEKTVRKIESGHAPSITTALKLANALEVPLLALFEDSIST